MSDDALIAGAAAPVGSRRIRSTVVLDSIWVAVAAAALIVSSRFALVDLPDQYLRTGEEPLRIWVVGLPAVALAVAVAATVRRSAMVAAVATGILAPCVALSGSLAVSLFLDDSSAFADAGVAVSLAASAVGAVMLLRWFVYHPTDVVADESRPLPGLAIAVVVIGTATGLLVVATAVIDAGTWTASFVVQAAAMALVPFLIVSCGVARTRSSMLIGAAAATAQIIGVLVARLERPTIALDSDVMLRTGVPGIVLLAAAASTCAVGVARHRVDDPVEGGTDDDDWRWTATD